MSGKGMFRVPAAPVSSLSSERQDAVLNLGASPFFFSTSLLLPA